jgi:hypothetical protein
MSSPQVTRYDLSTLLNFIPEEHFFRQKTKRIYKSFYQQPNSSNTSSQYTANTRRKSYLPETEVFSDERAIQEIRGALGKMSNDNKQNIIEILKKNTVSETNYNILVQLLHQYATLCLEWNDLYIQIYDKVYYQNNAPFYPQVFEYSKYLIENPKEYEDLEQKMFFRISNMEFYCKLGIHYSKFRKVTLLKWADETFCRLYQLFNSTNYNIEWLILLIHFGTTLYKFTNAADVKKIKSYMINSQWYNEINSLTQTSKLPIKISFKWMDFVELIEQSSSSNE